MARESERQRHLGMLDAVRGDLRKSSDVYKTRAAKFAEDATYEEDTRKLVASELTMVSAGLDQFANFIGMYLGRERYTPTKEKA